MARLSIRVQELLTNQPGIPAKVSDIASKLGTNQAAVRSALQSLAAKSEIKLKESGGQITSATFVMSFEGTVSMQPGSMFRTNYGVGANGRAYGSTSPASMCGPVESAVLDASRTIQYMSAMYEAIMGIADVGGAFEIEKATLDGVPQQLITMLLQGFDECGVITSDGKNGVVDPRGFDFSLVDGAIVAKPRMNERPMDPIQKLLATLRRANDLQSQVDSLNSTIRKHEITISGLQTRESVLVKQLDDARRDLKKAQDMTAERDTTIARLQEEIIGLKSKASTMDELAELMGSLNL